MGFKPHNHFVTGDFQSHAGFLSDDIYCQVMDNIVIACCDIIVVDPHGRMLLGFRAYKPMPGWWITGGRMMPGENFEQAAQRNIRRELALEVGPDRFRYLGTYSFIWAERRQEPQDHGSHTISVTMVLFVSPEEADAIKITEEYVEFKLTRPENIISAEGSYHPAVVQYARDLLKSPHYRQFRSPKPKA